MSERPTAEELQQFSEYFNSVQDATEHIVKELVIALVLREVSEVTGHPFDICDQVFNRYLDEVNENLEHAIMNGSDELKNFIPDRHYWNFLINDVIRYLETPNDSE